MDAQITEDDRPVTDLTASDFSVTDNGQPQQIIYFGRQRDPLALVLLLDVSGSMRPYLQQMAATAQDALAHLLPGDKVAIVVFGREPAVHTEFTDNLAEAGREIATAVENRKVGATTNINAAVLFSAQYLATKADPSWRRSILMLTDNLGLNYKLPDTEVEGNLLAFDVVFNAIVIGRGIRPGPPKPGTDPNFTPADVFKFAEWTGGDAMRVNELIPFAEMISKIRDRYTMEYRAPDAKALEFRNIGLKLTDSARARHPRAEVHTRSGYFAAGS